MNADLRGALHLVPVPLGGEDVAAVLPQSVRDTLAQIDYFIVENEKTARQFLARLPHPQPIRDLTISLFDKDGTPAQAETLLTPLASGRSAAVLSEAGCPAVADPGSELVRHALRQGQLVLGRQLRQHGVRPASAAGEVAPAACLRRRRP